MGTVDTDQSGMLCVWHVSISVALTVDMDALEDVT